MADFAHISITLCSFYSAETCHFLSISSLRNFGDSGDFGFDLHDLTYRQATLYHTLPHSRALRHCKVLQGTRRTLLTPLHNQDLSDIKPFTSYTYSSSTSHKTINQNWPHHSMSQTHHPHFANKRQEWPCDLDSIRTFSYNNNVSEYKSFHNTWFTCFVYIIHTLQHQYPTY